jgi:hypothetical protein
MNSQNLILHARSIALTTQFNIRLEGLLSANRERERMDLAPAYTEVTFDDMERDFSCQQEAIFDAMTNNL